jgi:type VI secretion system protein
LAGHSLLTRIQRPELAAARRIVSDSELREAVLKHLRMMCATRLGSCPSTPHFGVTDVSDLVHAFPDAAATMARSIKKTIETFEPRLANVRVTFVPSEEIELMLRFEVTAQLMRDGGKVPISFETSIDPSRRISIR